MCRFFNAALLDMVEFRVSKFASLEDVALCRKGAGVDKKVELPVLGAKSMVLFQGTEWEG